MKKLKKNHVLFLMASLFFIGFASTDIYVPSLPKIVNDFHSSPIVVNMTITVFSIGCAIFLLIADIFSSYFGRRPVIIWAVVIFTISSFLISISPYLWLIIILRFAQSSIALVFVTSRQVIKDIMDKREQLKANTVILSGMVISPAVAPVLGAHLDYFLGWRSCFVLIGLLGIISTFFIIKILPETNFNKAPNMPNPWQYIKTHFTVCKSSFFICNTLIYASTMGAFYSFIGISSYLFINKLKINPIFYSYIFILIAIAYLFGNFYTMHLNKKKTSFSKMLFFGVSFTLAGALVTFIVIFFDSSIAIAIIITIGSMLMRSANAQINPTTQILTINHFKSEGGIALGLSMSLAYAMIGISVAIISPFHRIPLIGLIFTSFLFSAIAIISYSIVKNKIKEE